MNQTYLRGDMYYADLGQGIGSEQEGYRPVVIIQNNVGNKHSPTVIIASVTSKTDAKPKLPFMKSSGFSGRFTPARLKTKSACLQ